MSFEQALQMLRAGRLAEAEAGLAAVVAAEPARAEALELLGVVVSSGGRAAEALPWFERALAVRPEAASVLHNRAQALFSLGRMAEARADLERALAGRPDMHQGWNLLGNVLAALQDAPEAERAYRRAITLNPGHPESHYNLGVFFQGAGRFDEAVSCYRKALALRPGLTSAHNNLANVLRAQRRDAEAFVHYAEAVRLDPGFGDGFSNYGAALREAGRVEEAIPVLERAVHLMPQSWAAYSNLGIAYYSRNRFTEAIACHRRALELRPDYHEAEGNLANALAGAGLTEEAEARYRSVIARNPGYADAHNNLGLLLLERGDLEGARAAYERTLELNPDHSDAINNLGFLLDEQGRGDEAIAFYRRAIAANPRSARAPYNLGIALALRLQFAEAWELSERRFDTTPPVTIRRPFPFPVLEAADLGRGHRIAVWREQGVGDQIVYATLLAELAARGEDFVAEVDVRLVPAFARAHPDWRVVAPEASQAAFAGCDRHIAAASLARLLRPGVESFAGQPGRLLEADAGRVAACRGRLEAAGAKRIGISWRSFQPKNRGELGRRKSASLAAFARLADREDLRLLDLQYGDTAAEREAFAAAGHRLERLEELDLFNDLDGLLAAIEACDAVVTTSNVTAHLAGAIGKRTLLVYLNARAPFHYWARRPDGRGLWYPSVQIVTGAEVDSWDKALARVDELLAR